MKKLLLSWVSVLCIFFVSGCVSNSTSDSEVQNVPAIETGSLESNNSVIEYKYIPVDSDEKNFDCLLWEENDGLQNCMQSWYVNTYNFIKIWLQLERRDTKKLGENYYIVSDNKIYANNPNNSEDIGKEQILIYNSLEEVQNVLWSSWCTITLSSYTGDIIQWLQAYEVSNNRPWPLCNTQNKEWIFTMIYKNLTNWLFYLFEGFDWCAPWTCNSYDAFKGI